MRLSTFLDALGLVLVVVAAMSFGAALGGLRGLCIVAIAAAAACFAASFVADVRRRR